MVERLAKKWAPVLGMADYEDARATHDGDARFFMLAIAEELERRTDGFRPETLTGWTDAIRWLRSQASNTGETL